MLRELCITVFMILEMQHDGELKYFKDMASYVKKRIEDEEKGTSGWHVIIGKYLILKACISFKESTFILISTQFLTILLGTNFGSYCTYETKHIALFWLEHIGFLLFKHG